jgi:thioredoxin
MKMARIFDAPIIANDNSLDRLLSAPLPVMLLFWQEELSITRINDALLRLAREEAGELIVAKVNVHDNPSGANRFGVRQPPALIGVRQGSEFTRSESVTHQDILAHAAYLLGRGPRPTVLSGGARNAGGRPVHVSDAGFEQEVLRSDVPVLVDFWAPWCGPCQMLAPVLDSIARDYAGKLRVAKVNVDQNPHYAGIFGIQGIPTLLLVRNGQVIERLVGMTSGPALRSHLNRFV